MIDFLKLHWDLCLVVFGFGQLHSKHNEQNEKIDKHDKRTEKLELILEKEIPEMKSMLARIDERTKKL